MDDERRPYEGGVIFVDPSGRGKEETAWAVMKVLNGILYLLKVGHEVTDPTKAMIEIAQDARRFNISMIEVEPNFGQHVGRCLPARPGEDLEGRGDGPGERMGQGSERGPDHWHIGASAHPAPRGGRG